MVRFKKVLNLLFAMLLLLSVTGSGYTQNNKIVAMLDRILYPSNGQNELRQKYKELTGVELEIIQPPRSNYITHLDRTFASEIMPDVIEIPQYVMNAFDIYFKNSSYHQLISEGKIIPLDQYINKSKIFSHIDKRCLDVLRVNGQIYGFPLHLGFGFVTYIRKDWLDNLGLPIPGTWDELYQVMWAFTYGDPDRNGKHDTIGYTLPKISPLYYTDFFQDSTSEFIIKNNRWVDGFTEPEFKNALMRLKRAYQDKLIEFTSSPLESRYNFVTGKGGIFCYAVHLTKLNEKDCKQLSSRNARIVAIPAIKETNYWVETGQVLVIPKSARNPEMVFEKFIEFINDGGKGQMLFTHGVEGLHYKKEGKGQYKVLDEKLLEIYFPYVLSLNFWNDPFPPDPGFVVARKALESNYKYVELNPPSEIYLINLRKIIALKQEIMLKIVKGEYSIDEGLKIYREKAKELGVEQILEEFNNYHLYNGL